MKTSFSLSAVNENAPKVKRLFPSETETKTENENERLFQPKTTVGYCVHFVMALLKVVFHPEHCLFARPSNSNLHSTQSNVLSLHFASTLSKQSYIGFRGIIQSSYTFYELWYKAIGLFELLTEHPRGTTHKAPTLAGSYDATVYTVDRVFKCSFTQNVQFWKKIRILA